MHRQLWIALRRRDAPSQAIWHLRVLNFIADFAGLESDLTTGYLRYPYYPIFLERFLAVKTFYIRTDPRVK